MSKYFTEFTVALKQVTKVHTCMTDLKINNYILDIEVRSTFELYSIPLDESTSLNIC